MTRNKQCKDEKNHSTYKGPSLPELEQMRYRESRDDMNQGHDIRGNPLPPNI